MNAGIFALGLILVIVGILSGTYTVYEDKAYFFGAFEEQNSYRPYSNFSIPLIVAGIIVMVVGAVTPTVRTRTERSYKTPVREREIIEKED